MSQSRTIIIASAAAVIAAVAGIAVTASAQTGPVATACKADITKHCAGKSHDGEVRACLTAVKAQVSAACQSALDNTGGGKGKGKGKGHGRDR